MKDFINPEINKLINSSLTLTDCEVLNLYGCLYEAWLNNEVTNNEIKEIFKKIPNKKALQILIWETFKNNKEDSRIVYNDEMRVDYNDIIEHIVEYRRQYGKELTRKDSHNPLHNLNNGNEIIIDFIYSMIADYNNESYLVIKNLKDYCYEEVSLNATDVSYGYFYEKNAILDEDKYVLLYNNENFYDINNYELLKAYIRTRRFGDAYKLVKKNYYTQRIIPNIEIKREIRTLNDPDKNILYLFPVEVTVDINDKEVFYKNFDRILKTDLLRARCIATPDNIGDEIRKVQFSSQNILRTSELLINFMLVFLENREYEDVEYILKIYTKYFRATADIEYIATRLIESKISAVRKTKDSVAKMSEIKKEEYYQAFSDKTKLMVSSIYNEKIASVNEDYYKIEDELKIKFGKNYWNKGKDNWFKLDNTSKYFLISSRLIYNNLLSYNANVMKKLDFSAPCILLTKALERELKLKLYDKLDNEFKAGEEKPSAYNKEKEFTLGSISYLTGYGKNKRVTTKIVPYMHNYRDKVLFLNAAEKTFFKNGISINGGEWIKGQDAIEEYIRIFSAQVIDVKNKYRDKAAHIDGIELSTEQKCYQFLIDSEKILIKFIENYNL